MSETNTSSVNEPRTTRNRTIYEEWRTNHPDGTIKEFRIQVENEMIDIFEREYQDNKEFKPLNDGYDKERELYFKHRFPFRKYAKYKLELLEFIDDYFKRSYEIGRQCEKKYKYKKRVQTYEKFEKYDLVVENEKLTKKVDELDEAIDSWQ